MSRKLRSNLEPGTALWAGRRAQWRALGISDEDMAKPKIAIVNSSSELSSCFSHLDGVADDLKIAIRAAGGLPFEVRTAAPSDFITSVGRRGAYILPTRDLIASDIEVQVEGALLDGMVCLASCDKTTPGQLMAAGRLNIPTIVVVCGYQQSGEYRGQHVDIEEVFLKSGYVASGAITVGELADMADVAVRSPGVCAGMGTANSMHVVCEALGMALPGSAPVAANSRKMMDHVRQAGARIVEMVWQDLKPRAIITPGAVKNAVLMVLALSGSINCVKHLQAIATEAELDVDVYQLFADYAEKVPLLAAIRPNGEGLIEDLEAAGGARAVLKRLERYVDPTALTVTGRASSATNWLRSRSTMTASFVPSTTRSRRDLPSILFEVICCREVGSCVSAGWRAHDALHRPGEHLSFARRSAGRDQARRRQAGRSCRAAGPWRHRRPRHGDDICRCVRVGRRRSDQSGRHDY